MLLLLRNHSDAFRHRKCLIPLALHCDYSWHGTTPGPQRSWAESRRLLLARDYAWPVTPAGRTDVVGGPRAALGPQVARERDWTVTVPHWAYWQQLKDLSLNFSIPLTGDKIVTLSCTGPMRACVAHIWNDTLPIWICQGVVG